MKSFICVHTNLLEVLKVKLAANYLLKNYTCFHLPVLRNDWFLIKVLLLYDTTLGIYCVSVCGCQLDDLFICFGAKPTQRDCEQDLPWDRKRARKGMSRRRGKDSQQKKREWGSRQKRVGRREQSREGQSRDDSKTERRQVNRSQKATAKTCRPTDAGLTNAR